MCLRDCFALGLALIVSDDTPTSPPVTFGLFNLIAVQSGAQILLFEGM